MVKRAYVLFALALLAAGCSPTAKSQGQKPTLTAAQQAEKAAAAKQAEISMRTDQINRSNLPDAQKQALLNQIRSSAGK
ncbi:MAG: hypothetical protein V4671_22205 [Armatimonadota bacterium]